MKTGKNDSVKTTVRFRAEIGIRCNCSSKNTTIISSTPSYTLKTPGPAIYSEGRLPIYGHGAPSGKQVRRRQMPPVLGESRPISGCRHHILRRFRKPRGRNKPVCHRCDKSTHRPAAHGQGRQKLGQRYLMHCDESHGKRWAGLKEYLYLLGTLYTKLQNGEEGSVPGYRKGSRNAKQIYRQFNLPERLKIALLPNEPVKNKNNVYFPLSKESDRSPFILTHKVSRRQVPPTERIWQETCGDDE